ncbi:hypothetical protein B0A48_08285 [Cryoendolithus antarcticus]|uniref:Uncharacterized protein n=1 Tax=Cryoendolithus antarcticus TaxID=1507870 RepID=A0A1V8T5R0_9PEZI|nr:hypothetical protein B0A48_08285 [Cryoendolithus antarcticus]
MENVVLELKKAVAGFDIDKDLHGWARSEREWGLKRMARAIIVRTLSYEDEEDEDEEDEDGDEDEDEDEDDDSATTMLTIITTALMKFHLRIAQTIALQDGLRPQPLPMLRVFKLSWYREERKMHGIILTMKADKDQLQSWGRTPWEPSGSSWEQTLPATQLVMFTIYLKVTHGDLDDSLYLSLPSAGFLRATKLEVVKRIKQIVAEADLDEMAWKAARNYARGRKPSDEYLQCKLSSGLWVVLSYQSHPTLELVRLQHIGIAQLTLAATSLRTKLAVLENSTKHASSANSNNKELRKSPTMPPPTAAEKVLGIVELVEMILIQLAKKEPIHCLFAVLRVNKTFAQAIIESKSLKKYMWLQYSVTEASQQALTHDLEKKLAQMSVDKAEDSASEDGSAYDHDEERILERIKPWYADAQPNPLLVMGWQQHPMMQIFHNEPLIMWRNNYLDGGIQLKCGTDYSMVREWIRKYQDWVPGGESWGDTLIADWNVEVFITLHFGEDEESEIDGALGDCVGMKRSKLICRLKHATAVMRFAPEHGRDLPLAQESDLPSMASSLDEHITMPPSKRRCHAQPSDVSEAHATPPAQSNINVKASATASTRDPSKSAAQQVFAIVELVEMILRQFGGRPEMKALYAVIRVSRTFQQTMASSTALRKAMWQEYEVLPRNARDECDAGSDGDDLEDESESEVGDEDGDGKDIDDDDEDEAGDEEDDGGWANGATTNPLVVPVNLNNKPGLVMLSQFNALDDNLDDDGRVAIDFHTDLDLHDWIAEYKDWKPSGASWERTFISDRPVSLDVHLLFDFDM